MPQRTVLVVHEVGLHARPAALFVQTAKTFGSTIAVRYKDKRADAKSILSVLTLGAGQNAELVISAEGEDSEAALDALERVLSTEG